MKFVLVPAGSFMMGSPEGQGASDEHPRHQVEISRPYYLGVTEVTQAQWKAVMGSNPSGFKGDNRPVENVSWIDAQEFIRRLNQKEGTNKYRLPTEAEWEYACRAGSETAYCFGDDESRLGDYAWYWHGVNSSERIQPVGQRKPNAWGLYDMHGNVFEWCADWYGWDYYAASPSRDPRGPGSPVYDDSLGGEFRVVRGGGVGWGGDAGTCRSACRGWGLPGWRMTDCGFRLARTTP